MMSQGGSASDVVLRDGSIAHVRAATREDTPLLLEFMNSFSPETLAMRFFTSAVSPDDLLPRLICSNSVFALIALREGKIIGHAAYYKGKANHAEVAVIISERFQGKGLGTILLGQIADFANKEGIETFDALVLPMNYQMIKVIRELGFPTRLKSEAGIIRVTCPTSINEAARELFDHHEAAAASAAMQSFFNPRAVAVIGASRDRNTIGGRLFRNILDGGFQGPVYPVNPTSPHVQSVAACKSILDCPDPVDLAIVVVPSKFVNSVARDCAKKGVKALVVISSGFGETDSDGRKMQDDLVDICRQAGMRLIGPNCMGILNTHPSVSMNAQFSPFAPLVGRIGFLSQSGALGIAIIDQTRKLGLGLSTFVSVGNKADISGNDLVQYWEKDPNTDLILMYLESFGNPRKFARLARRAGKKKPLIVVKSGRSSAGFRATQSHTGALLSASDVTVDALFRQSGVIRTDTLSEMFDAAAFLATQPVPKGNRVAIITNAGGAGILCADACEDLGLKVPELSDATKTDLKKFLPLAAGFGNPVDMIASATPQTYGQTIRTVSRDPNVDSIIAMFVLPIAVKPEEVAREILAATKEIGGKIPVITTFLASEGIPELLVDGSVRIPSYPFPESAARALAHAVRYGAWLNADHGKEIEVDDIRPDEAAAVIANALIGGEKWLTPQETATLLSCYGIRLVRTIQVPGIEEAAAADFDGRVVLKAIAPGLVHKTEAGAVAVGLHGAAEIRSAAERMSKRVKDAGFTLAGFIIQEMAEPGIEMLVGVTNDLLFGPIVACGAGGVLVELLKDVSVRVTPITDVDAREMVTALKTYPRLNGYRGGPKYDAAALENVIMRVGRMVEDIPEVAELDLNPVIVHEHGKGYSIVDARVRISEPSAVIPFGAKRR